MLKRIITHVEAHVDTRHSHQSTRILQKSSILAEYESHMEWASERESPIERVSALSPLLAFVFGERLSRRRG